MIYAKINDPSLVHLLSGPVWVEALNWVRTYAATAELGIHKLHGDAMFVNVQAYATEPRENCRFESHRRYIDLQYTIEGAEGIDFLNRTDLKDDGGYDVDKDLLFHQSANEACTLDVSGDYFCIFFPEDAHRPKVALQKPETIKKLVVKIDLNLLKNA